MTVREKLDNVIRDVLGDETLVLNDEDKAEDVPGWDSFVHVNLMFAIEEKFGVQFRSGEIFEFKNIGELRRYLETAVLEKQVGTR